MPGTRASKITKPPTMADNSPGLPGGADGDSLGAVPALADPTFPEVTGPAVVDLTDNDAAVVKLFLGALVPLRARLLSLSWTRALIHLQPSTTWMMTPLKASASYAENQNLDTLSLSMLRHSSSPATFTSASRP